VARITLRPLRSVDVPSSGASFSYLYDLGGERWTSRRTRAYGPPAATVILAAARQPTTSSSAWGPARAALLAQRDPGAAVAASSHVDAPGDLTFVVWHFCTNGTHCPCAPVSRAARRTRSGGRRSRSAGAGPSSAVMRRAARARS